MLGLAPVHVADAGAMMTLLICCCCTMLHFMCPSDLVIVCMLHLSSSVCGSAGK